MEQQQKAIKINKLNGLRVKCSMVYDKKLVRGVITGIPLSESVDSVKEGIKNVKVREAKRLKIRRNGNICDSLSILLTFEEGNLPGKVFIGYMSYDVRVYIPPPLRCFKCQRYGHVAAICKGKQRCSKCSGEHEYGKCEEGAKLKCCNCGGEHSAAYGGCEANKRMQEVQRVKVIQGVSFAEATKKVPKGVAVELIKERTKVVGECAKCDKLKEDTLIVSKSDFVLFMAEIINCSAQTRSRTERIKIIVKSAEKFLDVKGMNWERVRDSLKDEEQQSQTWDGAV